MSSKISEASHTNGKSSNLGKRKSPTGALENTNGSKNQKVTESQAADTVVGTNKSVLPENPANAEKEKYDMNAEMEDDDEEENVKWKSLEHHAVRFPPFYQPHGVPIIHKGEEIILKPEQEEIANYWAHVLGTEFAEKEIVQKNFEEAFLKAIDPDLGIEKLDDVDFSRIKKHLEDVREARNNRSAEEKKKEREENAAIDQYYRRCIIDGTLENVATVMVEPPGIFRGRGEHPQAGTLKSRIQPEYVTINIGPDNMIPKCHVPGHAWKAVVSKPECTWLGNFKDESKAKSGVKYLFLGADSSIKAKNDIKKYKKAKMLKENIESIQKDYTKRMASTDMMQAQLGTATYLIDKLALRVGNEKSEDEADTVGCCSLRVEHVTVEQDNKITLDFLGKDSMRFHQTIEVDPLAHKAIGRFVKGKEPSNDLFDLINASRLNDYLKELMPGLSAKVFRTYNASITLQRELGMWKDNPKISVEEKVKFYKDCNRQVAKLCNHQKAVPKNHEEQLKKLEDKLAEKVKKLKALEAQKKAIKKGKPLDKKGIPKTISSCDTAIQKAKKSITNEEYKIYEKKENKNIALSTSKINYMDPRISVTWCKNYEVPIEKVFEKTLRLKFAWAMSVDPTWTF